MEEEIYIEEHNPLRTKIIIIILLLIITIGFFVFLYFKAKYTLNLKTVKVEVGDKLNKDITFYLKNEILDEDDYKLDLDDVHVNNKEVYDKVGKYTYEVKYKNVTKKGKIIVEDNTKPKVEVKALTIGVNEDYDIDWFVTKCEDYSKPCTVLYKDDEDESLQTKAGNYNFDIIISDNAGNEVTKKVNLIVKKDYSLEDDKKEDLTITKIENDYDDWHKEVFVSFSKGESEEVVALADEYQYLYELTNSDLLLYLPYEYVDNQIKDYETLYVYNNYGYVIGLAIRVELDNGEYIYLTE